MKEWCENELYSADDDYTGLSLVSVESQIEGFIEEEEAYDTRILKKADINEASVL